MSAREIGLEFRITRNAVIGKVHRLRRDFGIDIQLKGVSGNEKGYRYTTKHRRGPRMIKPKPDLATLWKASSTRAQKESPTTAPDEGMASLVELRDHMCRWPYGNAAPYKFCGQQTEAGTPYCTAHCNIAFNKHEA